MGVNEDGTMNKFTDQTNIYLPPSFHEFEKSEIIWLRPEEYLREIAYETEVSKRRMEKKTQLKKKKTMRKQSILALGGTSTLEEQLSSMGKGTAMMGAEEDPSKKVNKEELQIE